MIKQTHYFDTANYDNYERCRNTAAVFGMEIVAEHRPTCSKQYHTEVTARTPEEVHVLDALILACVSHPGQDKYKAKLAKMIAERRAL